MNNVFEYLCERLILLESDYLYHPDFIKDKDLIITDKAEKILKKNPSLKQKYLKKKEYGKKVLIRKSNYGNIAFDFGNWVRGIGTEDPVTKKYNINWIGTHEDFNTAYK